MDEIKMTLDERLEFSDNVMDYIVPQLSDMSFLDGRLCLMTIAEQCQLLALIGLPEDRQGQMMLASQRLIRRMLDREMECKH